MDRKNERTYTIISLSNKEGKVVARLYYDFTSNQMKFEGNERELRKMDLVSNQNAFEIGKHADRDDVFFRSRNHGIGSKAGVTQEEAQMTKLKKEELLSILTAVFSYYLSKCNYKETATKYEGVHEQIKELIQKPEVTEERIEEKAIRLFEMAMKWFEDETITSQQKVEIGQGFIRSLIEEIT